MEQKIPSLGNKLEYKKLEVDVPYNVYYRFDTDPIHDIEDDRPQDTVFVFIDNPRDELVIGVTYDLETTELSCPGFKRPETFDRVMSAILGPLNFQWID
jgi:hypothetical protein